MTHFEQKGYITKSGKIKDSMKAALQSGTLELPQRFESARPQLEQVIRRSVEMLKDMEPIPKARIVTQTASIHIDNSGVTYVE